MPTTTINTMTTKTMATGPGNGNWVQHAKCPWSSCWWCCSCRYLAAKLSGAMRVVGFKLLSDQWGGRTQWVSTGGHQSLESVSPMCEHHSVTITTWNLPIAYIVIYVQCTPSNISWYTSSSSSSSSSSSYYDTHHPNRNPHLVSVLTQAEARLAHLWRTIGRAHSLCTLHCNMYKSSYSDTHHHHIMIYIIIILWYDEESDHSNKEVRKTPEIESGHKVSEKVKWT